MSKVCPMLFTRRDMADINGCCGERCAWWNPVHLECSVLTIALSESRKSFEERERRLHEVKPEVETQFQQGSMDPVEVES